MGCFVIMAIIAILLILAGLMDTFAKGRPDIGVPIIGVGVGILVIGYFIVRRSSERDLNRRIDNNAGSGVSPRVDTQGRFYCMPVAGTWTAMIRRITLNATDQSLKEMKKGETQWQPAKGVMVPGNAQSVMVLEKANILLQPIPAPNAAGAVTAQYVRAKVRLSEIRK